jgi:tetratricopeptide (TPR) repeat protein
MRQGLAVIALLVALGLTAHAQSAAQKRQLELERLLQDVTEWTDAVIRHEPGTLDAHAESIGMWSWQRLKPVLDYLRGRADASLRLRAATLYLDVALRVELEQRPRYPTEGRVLQAQDGRALGSGDMDPHIWWGRQVLVLQAKGSRKPFEGPNRDHAIAWYRTTSAMLARNFSLSNLEPHIRAALDEIPDDAGILFDAGCLAETFAAPSIQAVVPRKKRSSFAFPLQISGVERTRDENLLEAERYFRRALERDATMTEARVRLGRVLAVRGRTAEAARELELAAAMSGPPVVHYFAELFRGDTLERLGSARAAAEAFDRAAALFPSAQSPRLALSALRMERGEEAAARAAIERVWNRPAAGAAGQSEDPWWDYWRCTGRDAMTSYEALARRIAALLPGSGQPW